MCMIRVSGEGVGWSLAVDGQADKVFYLTGRSAETAARKLAARMTASGSYAEIEFVLRDGSLGGKVTSRPVPPGMNP